MPRIIDRPGIYEDFPIADYFADPCPVPSLSQSIAKILIDASPAHAMYAHPRLSPVKPIQDDEKYVTARAVGDVAHKLILMRGRDIVVCDFPDWRTNAAKEKRDAAIADGKIPILAKDMDRVQSMGAAILGQMRRHEAFPLPPGRSEVVLAWEEYGIWFRCLVDWLSADCTLIHDVKTTARTIPPHEVPAKLAEDGWDIQAAMIERGLNRLDPGNAGRRLFRFISIEQHAPYGLLVNELSESVMTMGRRRLNFAIRVWRHCCTTGEWPVYPPTIQRPEFPGWAEAKWLDRESAAAFGG